MRTVATPPHGTVRRYRIELKAGNPCERCRAANSQARAKQRANRRARDNRAGIHIVDGTQPGTQPRAHTADDTRPTAPASPPAKTELAEGVRNMVGGGIENAVRNYLNTEGKGDLLATVYGEIVIAVSRVIAIAEPKDIPKLTEEMVDAAKLMRPEAESGGSDDPFAGLGTAT